MVVYAVLSWCSSSLCLLESLTQPGPSSGVRRRSAMPRAEGVPGSLLAEDSFRPQNTPHRTSLALGAAPRDARAHGSIEEAVRDARHRPLLAAPGCAFLRCTKFEYIAF